MANATLFCNLSSDQIADKILSAQTLVCYAAPGIQIGPAKAMAKVAERIGPEMLAVALDFDERVMRLGYGDIDAVEILRHAGINIGHSSGLRSALFIVDGEGYIFTPTALYLEAENKDESARNALRLSPEQVSEAMARLSPAAKIIAECQAADSEERDRIKSIPVEVTRNQVSEENLNQVSENLKKTPPIRFNVARQVRVFDSYLEYVELQLIGCRFEQMRIQIPDSLQDYGSPDDLKGRLKTTFKLIGEDFDKKFSCEEYKRKLEEIREKYTRSLGNPYGRVVLKAHKKELIDSLKSLQEDLKKYGDKAQEALNSHLKDSRSAIVEYYLPLAKKSPSDKLRDETQNAKNPKQIKWWIEKQLDTKFPAANFLSAKIKLEYNFKGMTFETLKREDFLDRVKQAYPDESWDKAHEEYRAAGETKKDDESGSGANDR